MLLQNYVFILLLLSALGVFCYRLRYNIKFMQLGKGEEDVRSDMPFTRLKYMLANGLLQPKMLTDKKAAVMHYFIFYGFLVVSLGTLETLAQGITGYDMRAVLGEGVLYRFFCVSQDWGNTLVAAAVGYAVARRIFFPPLRLQGLARASRIDAFIILGLIFALVSTALLVLGLHAKHETGLFFAYHLTQPLRALLSPEGVQLTYQGLWWAHCAVLFAFLVYLPFSKHQHLIWVWANMFFKSRHSSGRLRPMKIDTEAESFGVSKVQELSWKQLLDGFTCVECGRCTEQCPAVATGKTLDPRLMIHHLKDAALDTQQAEPRTLLGEIVTHEELWACTTCGACVEACPLDIEHIAPIVDMRRYLTLTEGNFPPQLTDTFRNLETNSTPWAFSSATRAEWTKGLDVQQLKDVKQADYLFWVGCAGSFDERYKKVSRAIVKILQQAGVSFAILGCEEKCSGDTARRLGNEYLANMQIEENIENFKKYQVKKIITGCPHCFNTLKNEYPDYGFQAQEVLHHSQFIAQLVEARKITLDKEASAALGKMTLHDSCYLARHNDVVAEPRAALPQDNYVELPRAGKKGFCCGAGGGRMWLEETSGTRINENRAQEIVASGAKTAATSCPFCMTMVRDGVAALGKKDEVEVKDIAEVVVSCLPDRDADGKTVSRAPPA